MYIYIHITIYIYKDIPYIAEVTPKWFIKLLSDLSVLTMISNQSLSGMTL